MKPYRQVEKNLRKQQRNTSKSHLTFRELVNRKEENAVRVNCNRAVHVEVGRGLTGRGMFGKKAIRRQRVLVGGKGMMGMKECFDVFTAATGKDFVFSAFDYSRPNSQRGKSLSIISHLTTQTSQKQYISNPRKDIPKESSLLKHNQQEKPLVSYLSEKNINSKRPALKAIENINPIQQRIQPKPAEARPYFKIPIPKKANQKENINSANKKQQHVVEKNEDVIKLTSIQLDEAINPRFSFGEMMKRGLITPESINSPQKASFKLAGEEQLQGRKANDLQFQQFSSIISNQLKQTRKDMEIDSIKNQIQKISSCLQALQPRPEPKALPFRFRKKQEVVQHLVSARIVSKQSSSINIP